MDTSGYIPPLHFDSNGYTLGHHKSPLDHNMTLLPFASPDRFPEHMSERMSITSKQASIHRYCPERCVAFQLHQLAGAFFCFFTWRGCFSFCRVAIFTFTSYDDDRAYDMKLGGLFFIGVLLFNGDGVV
jgi:hypothetical protein